ncbi:efflux RND transporter periplasmic adaptor subunit [Glaciecola petra]|uniref:Efflux RND transporter periplasmic adaptor subunit n=1 Tax=Glaciecola petra TaxID=3075602 RepID=A0ABU2ZSV4_9ALTE|nr:efflux RND transporter periplasmic adaptor subunit [Aestuariibacter sp. P117]MDT0594649.1 efflux RND transporter periplasmic adaptor subunit [Aestuariibacter sp. P117]
MKSIILTIIGFITILLVAIGISMGIVASAADEEEQKQEDNRPVIDVESLVAINHQVKIVGFGEVEPLESTTLAAQVSGEVLNWNENFVAGGVVKRGEILFSIEPDTYEAAVLQAEAQISLAQATLTEELARQKVAQQEAKNLPKNRVSDLYLRKPQVISAKAQLKSAQASLRIAKRNLDKTLVRAPYDALVVSRDIGSGQFVNAGMRVAQINNIETAEVMVPIAGFDSPFLPANPIGISAQISTQDASSVQREGSIHRNLGLVDQSTRMQHLVIRINDPYGLESNAPKLKFGSYVQVSFSGRELESVFKVPQILVNNRKIWIVNDQDKLESHTVHVVREEGEYFFISTGVTERDRIAKSLPEYPQNGMDVKILDQASDQVSNSLTTANISL